MIKRITKNTLVLSAAALAALPTLAPAFADDSGSTKQLLQLPLDSVGLVADAIAGTPIAATRMSGKEIKEFIGIYKGDTPSWKLFGYVAAIPIAIGKGTLEGCFLGAKNAIVHFNKPFSKEAFSLSELE